MFDKIYFLIKDFVIEPLGVMQLIAVLKKEGYDVGIIRVDKEDPFAILNEGNFILLYSVITGSHKYFANLNYRLKYLHSKGQLFSIFGGSHPTYFPQYIVEQGIDAICRGEADEALPYLINQIKRSYYYDNSKSFWFKTDNGIIENELYPLCQDLDKLPFADRELVYHNKVNRDNPIKNFMASRGCNFSCLVGEISLLKANNARIDIKDISINTKLKAFDEQKNELVETVVTNVFVHDHDAVELYEITFDDNSKLQITEEHPVYTKRGWVTVGELLEVDEVLQV